MAEEDRTTELCLTSDRDTTPPPSRPQRTEETEIRSDHSARQNRERTTPSDRERGGDSAEPYSDTDGCVGPSDRSHNEQIEIHIYESPRRNKFDNKERSTENMSSISQNRPSIEEYEEPIEELEPQQVTEIQIEKEEDAAQWEAIANTLVQVGQQPQKTIDNCGISDLREILVAMIRNPKATKASVNTYLRWHALLLQGKNAPVNMIRARLQLMSPETPVWRKDKLWDVAYPPSYTGSRMNPQARPSYRSSYKSDRPERKRFTAKNCVTSSKVATLAR